MGKQDSQHGNIVKIKDFVLYHILYNNKEYI